jgi:ABC-2 type transport system ATP-binding protein
LPLPWDKKNPSSMSWSTSAGKKGLDKARAKAWSRDYLDRVDLADKASMRLDKLSGGQQQKNQLGVTIMNDPELLILDELTKGFDPVNRRLLMDIIEEQKRAGATVIMVTHQMEEVERLCDRVIPLKDGTSRAYGTVAEVQEQFGGTVYRLTYTGTLPPSSLYDIVSAGGGHPDARACLCSYDAGPLCRPV